MRKHIFLILFGGILFLLSTALFISLEHEIVAEKEDRFDTRIFDLLEGYLTPGVLNLFRILTFFGSTIFIISAYVILILYLFFSKRKKEAIAVTLTGFILFALLEGLKLLFQRVRPERPFFRIPVNFSFPSGHAFYSFVFYSLLVILIWRSNWHKKWKWTITIVLFIMVLLIGLSRIVLRYHFASDVIAGFSLGLACLSVYMVYLQIAIIRKF